MIFNEVIMHEGLVVLMPRLDADNKKDFIEDGITPEKQANFELPEEKVLRDGSMIEINLNIKFMMNLWKKALLFSFLFYCIILFIFIIIVTFTKKHFDFKLLLMISVPYIVTLILGFRYMYKIFNEKFISLTGHD